MTKYKDLWEGEADFSPANLKVSFIQADEEDIEGVHLLLHRWAVDDD